MAKVPGSAWVYSNFTLWFYDFVVHSLSARFAWKVDVNNMHQLYRNYLDKKNHLEIGVGTGLFLEPQVDSSSNIDIADVNPNTLSMVEAKLIKKGANVSPVSLDLYEPFDLGKRYQSIGFNYVLHCLEGDKQAVLERIKTHMAEDGVLFGSTLVNDDSYNLLGSFLLGVYNRSKVFSNLDDTEDHMIEIFNAVFPFVDTKREGRVLYFVAATKELPTTE